MYDFIIGDIIGFITDDLNHEDHDFQNLIHELTRDLKKSKLKTWKKESDISKELYIQELRKYKSLIDEIKEIRTIFQKGKIFANNNTKGKPKQFTPINMYLSSITFYLNRDNSEKAREQALFGLKSCKGLYSERTYYRLKKRIKELGIEI